MRPVFCAGLAMATLVGCSAHSPIPAEESPEATDGGTCGPKTLWGAIEAGSLPSVPGVGPGPSGSLLGTWLARRSVGEVDAAVSSMSVRLLGSSRSTTIGGALEVFADRCTGGPCPLTLLTSAEAASIADQGFTLSEIKVKIHTGPGGIAVASNGYVAVPPGELGVHIQANLDGKPLRVSVGSSSSSNAVVDYPGKTFALNAIFGLPCGGGISFEARGRLINQPPTALIAADREAPCTEVFDGIAAADRWPGRCFVRESICDSSGKATIVLDGTSSTDPDGNISDYRWDATIDPFADSSKLVARSSTASVDVAVGPAVFTLSVSDPWQTAIAWLRVNTSGPCR